MNNKPRISYVDPASVTDPAMLAEFDRCAREGTPRPESQAVRAHVPAVFWSFANSWRDVFKNGVADHAIKELCRIYVSRSVRCEYCGNQRSMKAARQGIVEDTNARQRLDFLPQHASNLAARSVPRMKDATDTVRGFASESGIAVGVTIESNAPVDQLAHVPRTIGHEYSDRVVETEAVAGRHRV